MIFMDPENIEPFVKRIDSKTDEIHSFIQTLGAVHLHPHETVESKSPPVIEERGERAPYMESSDDFGHPDSPWADSLFEAWNHAIEGRAQDARNVASSFRLISNNLRYFMRQWHEDQETTSKDFDESGSMWDTRPSGDEYVAWPGTSDKWPNPNDDGHWMPIPQD